MVRRYTDWSDAAYKAGASSAAIRTLSAPDCSECIRLWSRAKHFSTFSAQFVSRFPAMSRGQGLGSSQGLCSACVEAEQSQWRGEALVREV